MSEAVPTPPAPQPTPLTQPFWDGVNVGRLRFLRCAACGHAFLPAREECPACLSDRLAWQDASGAGTLVSWVVYHRAMHPAFAARLPYVVGIVELEEGARMISNIVGAEPSELRIDQKVTLSIETEDGVTLPRFKA